MIINIIVISLITTCATTGIEIKSPSEDLSKTTYIQETLTELINSVNNKSTKGHEPHTSHDDEKKISHKSKQLKSESKPTPNYMKIQYAPLPERFEKTAGAKKSNKVVAINVASTENPVEETLKDVNIIKTNVAPYFDIQRHNYRSFVPGYNIEVLQSANRSPGHNAVYRSYPEIFERNKGYKIAYVREYLENNTPEPSITETISTPKPPLHINYTIRFKPNAAQTLELHRPNIPLVSKIHRIHLNLARVYSSGRGIPQLPIQDKEYSVHVVPRKKNLPSFYPEVFEKKSQHIIGIDGIK